MVLLTGYGMITALGMNVAENKQALIAGEQQALQALRPAQILNTRHRELPLAEISLTNDQLSRLLLLDEGRYNRTTLLGAWALKETLSYLPGSLRAQRRIAFVNATTVGSMGEVETHYPDMISDKPVNDAVRSIDRFDCSECTREIAHIFNLTGFQATVSTACSSAANAIQFGASLIRNGLADIALCGGTDALTRFTLNGFNSLKNVDKMRCRPFDQQRGGLNLGEGAAYLLLESAESARNRQAVPLAKLAGYANSNEAHHPTAPAADGSGARRTMQSAIEHAGLTPKKIDFIYAHGTATLGNDLAEGRAIETLFGIRTHPPFCALKSYFGHTLAASGAIESIISCLSLQFGFFPPSLRFKKQMQELHISPNLLMRRHIAPKYILNNSFGFGGNDAALIFQRA